MLRNLTVTFGILLLLSAPLAATVIHIPADQPTIQAGINAAEDGDTVLVADGLYTGPGNRDIDFLGKAITVRSVNGPENCIVDAQASSVTEPHRCFIVSGIAGREMVLQGFTITGGDVSNDWEFGGGLKVGGATILDNVITGNRAYSGGGISVAGDALIAGNLITGNIAEDYVYGSGFGGGMYCSLGAPEIHANIISANRAALVGGGILILGADNAHLVNNLVVENLIQLDVMTDPYPGGAGIACLGTWAIIDGCTVVGNRVEHAPGWSYGGGICIDPPQSGWNPESDLYVTNSIICGNEADHGSQCYVGDVPDGPSRLVLGYCDIAGGPSGVFAVGELNWGTGMINADPLFAEGPLGGWYLGQTASGQPADSPCLDSGDRAADQVCFDNGFGTVCMNQLTTRTDWAVDNGLVDMGYHYRPASSVSTEMYCIPSSGTLPFQTTMVVAMSNRFTHVRRRFAGRIDVQPAGGGVYTNWRSGYTNMTEGGVFFSSWPQVIPALESLVGENTFNLVVMDVTPPPLNQPPYPPAGDTASDSCIVRGVAQ